MVFPLITENDKMLSIYITGIGNQNPQPKLERIKGFPSHQIFLITNGKGVFYTDKTHFHIKKGDILFVPKNVYHGYYPTQTPFSNRWVSFDGANTEQIFQYLSLIPLDLNTHYEELFYQLNDRMNVLPAYQFLQLHH